MAREKSLVGVMEYAWRIPRPLVPASRERRDKIEPVVDLGKEVMAGIEQRRPRPSRTGRGCTLRKLAARSEATIREIPEYATGEDPSADVQTTAKDRGGRPARPRRSTSARAQAIFSGAITRSSANRSDRALTKESTVLR